MDSKLEQVSGDITKVKQVITETKQDAEEEKDRASGANNIIIYRAPESSSEDLVKNDKAFCMELFSEVLEVDFSESDIKAIFRIGKKAQDQNTRPILIQLKEKTVKNSIMESLNKLKRATDKFRNLSITHDMTRKERDECKNMVEEAKKREVDSQGEFLFRVRGPPGQLKLIRIRRVLAPSQEN